MEIGAKPASRAPLIEVDNLTVDFWTPEGWANVVNHVSFAVGAGEAVGLVGESGCGKTTTAYSLLGYQRPNSRTRGGHIRFAGLDLLQMPVRALQSIRGKRISLVPQDPTTSLSPHLRVGDQLVEVMAVHRIGASRAERHERALELLAHVRIPEPAKAAQKYPHQLSGGQQQRVTIAMALAGNPEVLVLDEPTTGLDVTTQQQILDLLKRIRAERDMAMVYVTHNLGVLAAICDRVAVMYAGELIEDAPAQVLFQAPRHPYTRGLIGSIPRLASPRRGRPLLLRGVLQRGGLPPGCRFAPRCDFAEPACFAEPQTLAPVTPAHRIACRRWSELPAIETEASGRPVEGEEEVAASAGAPLLAVGAIDCTYGSTRHALVGAQPAPPVVRQVSLDLRPGETVSLVGESGSGKSTIARAIAGLLVPTAGTITFEGRDIAVGIDQRPKQLRRELQLVLQNPDASLNPRQRVAQIVGRPLQLFFGMTGEALGTRVTDLLAGVRLDASYASRFPDELSGGERQRVAIARALAAEPKLIVCDEILSALDVSVQASVLDLLRSVQAERGIAYLFISHDLAVVRSLSHRVGVLYHGEMCEVGAVDEVYAPPFHPYTYTLLSAVPEIGAAAPAPAAAPEAPAPGPGTTLRMPACPFADKCPWKVGAICEDVPPPWQAASTSHAVRCHIPLAELTERERNLHLLPMRPATPRGGAVTRVEQDEQEEWMA